MRVVLLLAISACGDNLEVDPNVARSGYRLKLVHHDYGDGTRETETRWFHDAARDERCTPHTWSDGVTLCTPEFTDTVFPTSECARALGRVAAGAAVPPYFVRHYWLAGGWVPSRIYRPGELVEVPAQAWELREGACLGPYDTAGFDYYELDREVERAGLVRITHPEVASTSRLELTAFASADGLYAPTGLYDRDLDERCIPAAAPGADATACVPDGVANAEYFHDAQCSKPELALAPGDRLPAVIRHHDARSGCTSYHAVGAEVSAPPLFHRNGPVCVDIAAPTDNRYYLAGAPRELAGLDRVRDPASRRLQPIELQHGGLRIADARLYDSALATECRRGELDGLERCLPETTVPVIELFADQACQAVIPLAEISTGACATPATFARAPDRTLHAIGAVHASPLYHLSTGDRCLPYALPEGIAFHDVAPALPADAFATATIVIDP